MDRARVRALLRDVQAGKVDLPTAFERMRGLPYEDLGFAKVDRHRALRKDFPEVVYCPGKTDEQILRIVRRLSADSRVVLATRAAPATAAAIEKGIPHRVTYHDRARLLVIGSPPKRLSGNIVLATAGTSDLPVAEEAAVTAECMGARVERLYDVGVAGLHRLLENRRVLEGATVVVVVAGMEGALPSVVAGLVSVPVIAVPTSVGYGANFGGLAALLAMMNSCAPGVAVVNIDNGFGAGYLAATINARSRRPRSGTPPRTPR